MLAATYAVKYGLTVHDLADTWAPYPTVLPDSAVACRGATVGACTVEIGAFDEFIALLAGDDLTAGYDHVVFDTAPTGHTLRLLALPAAWTTFIGDGTGTSCLGELSGLQAQQGRYATAVATLADPALTTLLLVTRPDTASVVEADRASTELRALGIGAQRLVVNGVFTGTDRSDPLAAALDRQTASALDALPTGLVALPRTTVPLLVSSPVDLVGLRDLAATGTDDGTHGDSPAGHETTGLAALPDVASLDALVDDFAAQGSGWS